MGSCAEKSVTDDLPLVEHDIGAIKKRWDELRTKVDHRRRFLSGAQEEFHQYHKSLLIVEEVLVVVEEIVTIEYVLELDIKDIHDKLGAVKVGGHRL